MKKIKSVFVALLVLLFIPFIPAAVTEADYNVHLPNKAEYAEMLGVSESLLDSIVKDVYSAIENYETQCNLIRYGIIYSEVTYSAIHDVIFENPEFFHIDVITVYYSQIGYVTRLELSYAYTEAEYEQMLGECLDEAETLTEGITADMSDLEKTILIHDRLAVHCEYDYLNLLNNTVSFESYTMYGTLVNRISVCQGYARAMNYLLDKVGVASYSCASDTLNHMWIIVYIDGVPYHIDTTWDDPILDLYGRVLHTNLLLSTEALKQTFPTPHEATDFDSSPTSTKYDNAFWQSSESAFCFIDGKFHYVNNDKGALCEYDFDTNLSTELLTFKDRWPAGSDSAWLGNFTRLATDGKLLYYSLPDGIYSYDPKTSATRAVFLPDMSEHDYFSIYGFKLDGNTLYCQAYSTPNVSLTTESETYVFTLSDRIVGDVSNDGLVCVDDALLTLRASVGLITLDAESASVADYDGDGAITVSDALGILRLSLFA